MEGFISGTSICLAVLLAVIYFNLMTLLEVIRVREDPDQPRSAAVEIYLCNTLFYGIIAGVMVWPSNDFVRLTTFLVVTLYIIASIVLSVRDKLVPMYDRILMITGGLACFVYLASLGTWNWFNLTIELILEVIIIAALVMRLFGGYQQLLRPPR
jgi:hypothetical protein